MGSFSGGRRSSRRKSASSRPNSVDWCAPLASLEACLTEKTDLIDDMKKVLPITVQAPGIVAIGMRGSGKSTILEALSGVPLSHASGLQRPVRVKIVSDPTCTKEYVLVSGTDPLFKQNTRRLEHARDLPACLAALDKDVRTDEVGRTQGMKAETNPVEDAGTPISISQEEEEAENIREELSEQSSYFTGLGGVGSSGPAEDLRLIYVRVVRPSGPTYTIIDFPAFSSPPRAEEEAYLNRVLAKERDPASLVLAVMPVKDVFDRAEVLQIAKRLDPGSKQTIGVVTKMHLVTKGMGIVEKLQMNGSKAVALPLGYVAVCAADPGNPAGTYQDVLDYEAKFFTTNPLLKGLKPERWGLTSLKSLVIHCQTNSITQRIPGLSQAIRSEIEDLSRTCVQNDERIEQKATTPRKKKSLGVFENTKDVFSKLCSEMTLVMFDINDLANGSSTRQDRKLNLGPRFLIAVETREAEARRALPVCNSSEVADWLWGELQEFGGVASNSDSIMHPIFRKAVRELFFPVLRGYAKSIIDDLDEMLKYAAEKMLEERFGAYSRLVESLTRDVTQVQETKKREADALIARLLEAELNWVLVDAVDMAHIEKETAKDMEKSKTGDRGERRSDMWGMEGVDEEQRESKLNKSKSGKVFMQSDHRGELQAMQSCLHQYVHLLLRRMFYAVPMNTRNVMINEFRDDVLSVVTGKYNEETKLRALMSEELWAGHSRQQQAVRRSALEEVMNKLDLLS